MCGVIVVDAGSFWSTWHGRDVYIHDHCLRYRHNFALFYQLLGSNLFTHRNTYAILREATSEAYGPRVYFTSYKFPIYYFAIFYFPIYKPKIPKIFTLSFIYLYQISLLEVTVMGFTTPLSRWVQVVWLFVQVFGDLCVVSYWIANLSY